MDDYNDDAAQVLGSIKKFLEEGDLLLFAFIPSAIFPRLDQKLTISIVQSLNPHKKENIFSLQHFLLSFLLKGYKSLVVFQSKISPNCNCVQLRPIVQLRIFFIAHISLGY